MPGTGLARSNITPVLGYSCCTIACRHDDDDARPFLQSMTTAWS